MSLRPRVRQQPRRTGGVVDIVAIEGRSGCPFVKEGAPIAPVEREASVRIGRQRSKARKLASEL